MIASPKAILSAVAILCGVFGIIWPNYPLVAVGVLLLGVANFVP